jgi:hypothetical protein
MSTDRRQNLHMVTELASDVQSLVSRKIRCEGACLQVCELTRYHMLVAMTSFLVAGSNQGK